MKIKNTITCVFALCAMLLAADSGRAASPLATGFSYQGRLFDQGAAANGNYDMIFILRDQATGGNAVGSGVSLVPVAVSNGLFQATLDFGTNVWGGSQLWLDVSVRSNGVNAGHVLLTPSQLIQPVPYAIHAIKAGELVGPLPGGQLSGVYSNVVNFSSGLNAFSGSGAGLTSLNAGQLTGGLVPDARLAAGITRDSELLSVSNSLAGRLNVDSGSLAASIAGTSNGLSARLIATETALGSRIGTTSNSLRTTIDGEIFQRTALQTRLASGDNSFAGSNLFIGITLLTNGGNVIAGDGSALTGLNGSAIAGGTVPDARLSGAIARTTDLLAVSNNVAGLQVNDGLSNAFLGQLILSTDSNLTAALLGTNAALMMKIATSSNALQTAIDVETAARAALATQLQTGANSFAGSNHFSGIALLTNTANVLAGDGSGLTGLNGSQVISGTLAEARIDAAIARDSEMLSVSNSLSTQLGANNSALVSSLVTTSNGLDARLLATNSALIGFLDATNAVLMSKITTASNALDTAIGNEATARAALVTQLGTGDSTFAGSNHFSGITLLTNTANRLAGDGSGLLSLNAGQISSGMLSLSRLPSQVVVDDGESGINFGGSVSAPSFSGGGSGLTSLNASQLSSGTVVEARIDATLTRDTELNSVSNTIAGNLNATNTALMSEITTTSNALDTAIGNEATARAALVTQLGTGDNTFAGSNHFSGIALLTNAANNLAGDGSGLTGLNADQLISGTVNAGRLPAGVVIDDAQSGVTLMGNLTAPSFSGDGSSLTTLNASSLTSGTVADARLDAAITRDSELNSVSNIIAGNFATADTALMSTVTTTSNALDTAIANEATARTALQTQLQTGNNAFAGSNHFSGLVVATNVGNVLGGDGTGLTGLWKTGGNSGTTPETQFIGTSDAQPVVLKANNERVLRLEEGSAGAPNFIGGSRSNLVSAGVYGATISGGGAVSDNEVIEPNTVAANFATISGGKRNDIGASARASVIGGGEENVVSANAVGATVGGGIANRATNSYATVPGGFLNRAGGQYSFAAGRQAKANHDGAFVWADSQGSDLTSSATDTFSVRAKNGIYFTSASRSQIYINGVRLMNENDDSFAQSDRRVKKNFQPLDTIDVVEKLAAMPIEYWQYKKDADDATPHMGPYAQDFKGAFYPGRDDTKISWLEFHGVELAAIQGLNKKFEKKIKEKDNEIAQLRAEMEALKQMVQAMSRAGGTQ
jgi:hypothetical protein